MPKQKRLTEVEKDLGIYLKKLSRAVKMEVIANEIYHGPDRTKIVDGCYVYKSYRCPNDGARLEYGIDMNKVYCPKCDYVFDEKARYLPIPQERKIPVWLNIFERKFD